MCFHGARMEVRAGGWASLVLTSCKLPVGPCTRPSHAVPVVLADCIFQSQSENFWRGHRDGHPVGGGCYLCAGVGQLEQPGLGLGSRGPLVVCREAELVVERGHGPSWHPARGCFLALRTCASQFLPSLHCRPLNVDSIRRILAKWDVL